jgi:hypothetical protein
MYPISPAREAEKILDRLDRSTEQRVRQPFTQLGENPLILGFRLF